MKANTDTLKYSFFSTNYTGME